MNNNIYYLHDVSTYIMLPGIVGSECHISGISGELVSIPDRENSYSSSLICLLPIDEFNKEKLTSRLICKRVKPINRSPNKEKIIDNVLNAVTCDTSSVERTYVVINNKTFNFVYDFSMINEGLHFITSGYFLKILPNFIIDMLMSVANVIQTENNIINSANFAYVHINRIDNKYTPSVEKYIVFLTVLISFLSSSTINKNLKYKEI